MKLISTLFLVCLLCVPVFVFSSIAVNEMNDYMSSTKTCYRPVYETISIAADCIYNVSAADTVCTGAYNYTGDVVGWEGYTEDSRISCKGVVG